MSENAKENLPSALEYFFDESSGKYVFNTEEWKHFEYEVDKQVAAGCKNIDFEKALEGVINFSKNKKADVDNEKLP